MVSVRVSIGDRVRIRDRISAVLASGLVRVEVRVSARVRVRSRAH